MQELRKLATLGKNSLTAKDGEIGRVEEVYLDDRQWIVRYLVVRSGSWLLGRKVLILPAMVTGIDDEAETVRVDLTRQQVKDSPPLDHATPVSRHYEQAYYGYYGWRPYWADPALLGAAATAEPGPASMAGQAREPEEPHLRSSREVAGYGIRATDGKIGHVEDFIIETQKWTIRYLEVDTRAWLPGKHILLAPTWIRGVEWAAKEVTVDVSREAIEAAPPYDPSQKITRDYEVALYKHYGRSFDHGD